MLTKLGNAMKLTKAVHPNSTSIDGKLPDSICEVSFGLPYVLTSDRPSSSRTCDIL